MPWNNQGGGGGGGWQGGGRGPWGQGPSGGGGGGGGGPQPPNLEDLLRRGQAGFRRMAPGGRWGGKGIILGLLVLVGLWMFSGFYRVQTDEQGVVLRFGKYSRTTAPGLNYHLPSPIETAITPKVTREQQVDIGFRSASDFGRPTANRDVLEEALMLTGDENIVDINFAVVWRIKDARDFLFNIQQPASTVKAVAESTMREIVGRSKIDDVLTEGRAQVEIDATELMQETLDSYGAGIDVVRVKLQKADPPAAVIDAFRDVQRARADQERLRNEAQAYANDIIPRARGEAEQNRLEAEGYRERVVAEAEGEAARYLSILKEYQSAREVTKRRMFLEVMEQVYENADKVILDTEGGSGVVPYLPLPELQKRRNSATQGSNQ